MEFYISKALIVFWLILFCTILVSLASIDIYFFKLVNYHSPYKVALSILFLVCGAVNFISIFLFRRSVKVFYNLNTPLVVFNSTQLKYRRPSSNEYSVINYAEISKMSVYQIKTATIICVEKKDASVASIEIGLFKSSPKNIFEYILTFRKDLNPIGGWDWAHIQ